MSLLDRLMSAKALLHPTLPPGWTWDGTSYTLRIAGSQVALASRGALGAACQVQTADVQMMPDHLQVSLELVDGFRVQARVVPLEARLEGDEVLFVCELPGGVQAGHRNAILTVIIELFDGVFGLTPRALRSIPDLSVTGTRLEWRRSLADARPFSVVLTGLRLLGVVRDPHRIRLAIEHGDLVLWFKESEPGDGVVGTVG
jgi:hypothetical protein